MLLLIIQERFIPKFVQIILKIRAKKCTIGIRTNGKTTTATLLYKIFNLYGYKVGLLSTNKILIDAKEFKTDLTTPDTIN